jgi:hypothetical protein
MEECDGSNECFGDIEVCIAHTFFKVLFDLIENRFHRPVADLVRVDIISTVLG